MPDNKNQHYVPRCHLKPFSLNREGVAINLYNHPRDIIRGGAPIAGQCAKSYFYGEDLVIERALQKLEGRYAAVVRCVEADEPLDAADAAFLRDFVLLQWCRTDGALRRRREVMQAMDDAARRGLEHIERDASDMSQIALISGSLSVWASAGEDVKDLRVLILRNHSGIEFVTSDDPAVVTNRVFLQRMRDPNFGIVNVGALLVMPLSPRRAVVCYDHDCYAPIGRSGSYLNVNRHQDAAAFNEFQYLNAISNVYFAGPIANGERIRSAFAAIAARRPPERFRMWQGISEGIAGEFECFRQIAEGEEIDPMTTRIQSFSPIYPCPQHWLSVLPMRARLSGWVKPGAVGGPIRFSRAKRHRGMERVSIGHRPMPHRGGRLPDRMYHHLSPKELRERTGSAIPIAARNDAIASDEHP
ncbi:MAG TPA: DUF4238 domain-containing protein [Sphingomonas sp.]|jgi:hypothetical protein